MGKKEFETECKKKKGHRPKIVSVFHGIPIDVEDVRVMLECCNCGAVSTIIAKWTNPEE
jgi:hypothetical protein